MKKLYLLLFFILGLGMCFAEAQTVLNPNDTIVPYVANSGQPAPTQPTWGSIGKWVRTSRLSWNTSSYKCYIYKGMAFRLKFPKNYNPADSKKYPLIMFFHGLGEAGTIYDNEYQLLHGGETHKNQVDNGNFDGFLFYPQNQSGFFGATQYDLVAELINNFFIPQINVDPFRITVEGLSGGGTSTWDFTLRYPKLIAGLTPISAVYADLINSVNVYKYTPIWEFQGELDGNPTANIAVSLQAGVANAGGNMKLSVYAGQGHGVWDIAWAEPDYFPFMNRANKANPWPVYGRTEFCPGDPINVTLGLTAGFDAYEWRKDGALISGATGNTTVVTTLGTYDARVKSGTTWSSWSPIPVQIKIKTPTVSPDIQISGLMSKVIPTPEVRDSVVLQVPAGYSSYVWKNVADTTATLSTKNTLTVKQAASYMVRVTELYGCSSSYSTPFKVIPANGTNAPAPATGLLVSSNSKTGASLTWTRNPNQTYPETGFEIYRAKTSGGPYTFVGITNAGAVTYEDQGLTPNTQYFYIVRAVNNNGAAAVSNQASATTQYDSTPPTAPGNLTLTGVNRSSASLSWTASTDDVGVDKYDIFINGLKSYTVTADQTSFTAYGLTSRQTYTFVVKARDAAGNISPASNQVSAVTVAKGLDYKYYTGTFSVLPDFTTLTPVKTGTSATTDLSVRTQETNYAILWQGVINIPVSGNYTFETNSDDGSKLYIGTYSPTATALVNNDGLHGTQFKEGTINLTAGVYPIAISYFQQGGGQTMEVYWKNTANGVTARQLIPASFFTDTITVGNPPAAASNVKATALSYNKVKVTWNDNSNNETGFEVYRGTAAAGPYNIVTTTNANTTSYTDSLLTPLTTYYYQVKAINKNGTSGISLSDLSGLQYDYYEAASYSALPNFNALTPIKTGVTPDVNLNMRNRDVNYAIKYSGYINIPTTGLYTFFTASDDGSKLYIDGFDNSYMVVNNDYLQGTTERSGTKTLTAGLHQFYATYFQAGGGQEMHARYQGPGIAKMEIPASAFENVNVKATTLALPPLPTAPGSLTGTAISGSTINLKWNDNSNNETGFEIYRSVANNVTYALLATKASSDSATAVYTDTALLSNTVYYYKVRAFNEAGKTAYTNELSVTTLNNPPVLQNLSDKGMRYGTQLVINLIATDPDNEAVNLSATNVPAFGTLVNNGNGTGTLTFNPSISDQGVYTNIQVTATDQHGGTATKSFTLTVNDNYPPVLGNISNVNMSTGGSSLVTINATDNNATDVLTWTADGLPAFATLTPNGNSAQIQLSPGFADGGVYPVTVTVNDGRSGVDTKSFTITVKATSPGKVVFINFNDGTSIPGGYWNSTNKPPVQNDVYANLKDSSNNVTGIGFKVLSLWQNQNNGTNVSGAVTNNNSGVYPDNVMRTAWWSGAGSPQALQLTGLNLGANYTYKVTFFGSRGGVTDNRTSIYTINGTTVSLNAANNTTNTVSISNVIPDSTGAVRIDINNGTGSSFSYLNAMVIEAAYDDHAAPIAPKNIAVQLVSGAIKVNWSDAAYNETGYEVHRATVAAGPYTLLNPTPSNANATSYLDSTIHGSTRYWYKVRAINSYGASAFSDTASVLTNKVPPSLAPISDILIKTDSILNVAVSATGDAGSILTLSATGLPPFATFTDNGSGSGTLSLTPNSTNVGVYSIVLKVTDNNSNVATRTISVTVKDKNTSAVYVNFNEVNPATAPWNNFNTFPYAGRSITNMVNDQGATTPIAITLIDAIAGSNTLGAVTGNNSGVYPDNVMNTAFYESATDAKRIRITGLPLDKKYNLVFFGSRTDVTDNRNTDYTVGTQTVTLNAASNTKNVVQISGLSPDASGQIEFTIKRSTGSSYAYLNALVIQSYVDMGLPVAPSGLTALGKSRSSISLKWADNSGNETAFELWRSGTADGTYSLLATLPANTTTYQDNGLAENTAYYYKVRAAINTNYSAYTSVAVGQTYAYSVYMQFNRDYPAGAPWNSTNAVPNLGDRYSNLLTEKGDNSGLAISIQKNFSGDNNLGKMTGNNSGVYPDNVLRSSFWVDGLNVARLRVEGLNQSQAYTFVFCGSRDGGGDRTSIYTVNGKSTSLDCSYNTTQTAQLDNITPDENGYVNIDISLGPNSQFAYIGALVISSYGNANASSGGSGLQPLSNSGIQAVSTAPSNQLINKSTDDDIQKILVQTYPNPFDTYINLTMDRTPKQGVMLARLVDSQGRLVYGTVLPATGGGPLNQRIDFGGHAAASGFYLLQITSDNKLIKTIKLIKK